MMSSHDRQELDHYLTTPPENPVEVKIERVCDEIDAIFDKYGDGFFNDDDKRDIIETLAEICGFEVIALKKTRDYEATKTEIAHELNAIARQQSLTDRATLISWLRVRTKALERIRSVAPDTEASKIAGHALCLALSSEKIAELV